MTAGSVVRLDSRNRVSIGRFTDAKPGALFEIANDAHDAIVLRRVYVAPRPTEPFDGTELEEPQIEVTA